MKQWGQQTIEQGTLNLMGVCVEQANGTLKQSMMANDNTKWWVEYLARV